MTTQNLEDVIRDLAARGELNHISLSGPSSNSKKFRASFAMCSKFGISFGEDEDPVKAVMLACTTAKMKPQRTPSHRPAPTLELQAERIAEKDPATAEDLQRGLEDLM